MHAIYNAVEGVSALLGENSVLTHSIVSSTSLGMESMTGGGKFKLNYGQISSYCFNFSFIITNTNLI